MIQNEAVTCGNRFICSYFADFLSYEECQLISNENIDSNYIPLVYINLSQGLLHVINEINTRAKNSEN